MDMSRIDKLCNDLPGSGFGIDATTINSKNAVISAWYHCMNENGYYDGYAYFNIYIPLSSKKPEQDFTIHFVGSDSQYRNRKYYLREFIEDTVRWILSDREG